MQDLEDMINEQFEALLADAQPQHLSLLNNMKEKLDKRISELSTNDEGQMSQDQEEE